MARRQRVQTGNIADVIGELFQDVGAGLPEIALTLHNIKRQSEQDQFQREDRLAAQKDAAARIAQGEERIDIAREGLNIRQLQLLDERDEGVTGVFRDIFPKKQKPLTPTELFGRELGLDPELLKRYTAAQVEAAERRAQGPAAKGLSLAERKDLRESRERGLSTQILELLLEKSPEFATTLAAGDIKLVNDPIFLEALTKKFLPDITKSKPRSFFDPFPGDTTIAGGDPQIDSLLEVLSGVFSRPALEFEGPLTAEEKAELKRRKAVKAQQGGR